MLDKHVLQKVVFYNVKGGLLHAERRSFARRKVTF